MGNFRECEPDSLDEHKVKGKIVVCEYHVDDYSIEDRINEVKNKGGIGFVLVIPDDELNHSGTQTRILSRCSNHSRGWHKDSFVHQLNKVLTLLLNKHLALHTNCTFIFSQGTLWQQFYQLLV